MEKQDRCYMRCVHDVKMGKLLVMRSTPFHPHWNAALRGRMKERNVTQFKNIYLRDSGWGIPWELAKTAIKICREFFDGMTVEKVEVVGGPAFTVEEREEIMAIIKNPYDD